MTYIEMCYKINELLFNIDANLKVYEYLTVYYNASLLCGNLRGNIEDISTEINDYLAELMNDANRELDILRKMDNYITRIVTDYTNIFFEDSEEFHLFESIIKRINNSSLMRLKSTTYVFKQYNNLIALNAFNNKNYKILKREKYISDEEYQSYLELSL